MNLSEKRAKAIQEDFLGCVDWEARYEKLIKMGKELSGLEDQFKTADHLVKGCQSQVWLVVEVDGEGKMQLRADSDALIAKGLVALLIGYFNEMSPGDVLKADLGFIANIGLVNHLSPNRANGLNSMIKQIRYYALAFAHKAGQL